MFGLTDQSAFHKDDIFMNIAPVKHIGGFSLIFGHLSQGACVVLVHKLDFGVILSGIATYKPTSILLFPTFVAKLAEHPLLDKVDMSSIKKLLIGGTTASSSLLRGITLKLGLNGVIQVYGMTELSGCIAHSIPSMDDFKSVGTPAPFVEIKVVDESTRKPLGPYELGEICVKSPGGFKGYLNNPKATAATYENDFVRTGDVGHYSPDGRIFVCGRLKELIKCMDQQVAPAELEELLASDPGVLHAVVAGVPHPQFGEAARAFVLPRKRLLPGSAEEKMEAQRLQDLVAGNLAAHKHLHGGVEFLESVPQNSAGKDLRTSLKEMYIQKHCKVSTTEKVI
ncbi:luciferin 4-monooxygenase-like [Amblyomma americanum]